MVEKRKWLPAFADLVDRLSIFQLKEVLIPENKEVYASEMSDIVHDLDILISEKSVECSGELLHAIVILAQINAHIWYNEAAARRGEDQDLSKLKLTHGLNGMRSNCMNYIKCKIGEGDRVDLKADCLAAEFNDWKFSLFEEKDG